MERTPLVHVEFKSPPDMLLSPTERSRDRASFSVVEGVTPFALYLRSDGLVEFDCKELRVLQLFPLTEFRRFWIEKPAEVAVVAAPDDDVGAGDSSSARRRRGRPPRSE